MDQEDLYKIRIQWMQRWEEKCNGPKDCAVKYRIVGCNFVITLNGNRFIETVLDSRYLKDSSEVIFTQDRSIQLIKLTREKTRRLYKFQRLEFVANQTNLSELLH